MKKKPTKKMILESRETIESFFEMSKKHDPCMTYAQLQTNSQLKH